MPKVYASSLVLPILINGEIQNVEFTLKDEEARQLIENLGHAVYWMGVTTTVLTDGAITNPITINSESKTAELGGMASYNGSEFVWNGTSWQEMGKNNFGALAFKSSATGIFTPQGEVTVQSQNAGTTVVNSITNPGSLPYFTVDNEVATFHAGTLPTKGANQTVLTDVGTLSGSFSGTQGNIEVS